MDTGSYGGYTRGHNSMSSYVCQHYDQDHTGAVPDDLLSCFRVLEKYMNKLDCLVNEMLYIKQLRPQLNMQTDSIHAKVLFSSSSLMQIWSILYLLYPSP